MNDVCQLLFHPVCNGTPMGHDGSEGGVNFMYFWEAIKLLGGQNWLGTLFCRWGHLSPPVHLMSLSVCVSFFLSLVVGSLLMFL